MTLEGILVGTTPLVFASTVAVVAWGLASRARRKANNAAVERRAEHRAERVAASAVATAVASVVAKASDPARINDLLGPGNATVYFKTKHYHIDPRDIIHEYEDDTDEADADSTGTAQTRFVRDIAAANHAVEAYALHALRDDAVEVEQTIVTKVIGGKKTQPTDVQKAASTLGS